MTDILHTIILALVQGLTEFLPISSSAHLILVPKLLGWVDQGLALDVALHLGSLLAVLHYFRRDLWAICVDFCKTGKNRLAWAVIIGTIPVGLVGLLCNDLIKLYLRSEMVIIVATVVFGLLLLIADKKNRKITNKRGLNQLQLRDVIIIGLAQAVALIPGTSRSGITITAGLYLGLTPQAAAKFSFLLVIPVIILASGLEVFKLSAVDFTTQWQILCIGCAVSGVVSYGCIRIFMQLLARVGMMPWVIYRLILAAVLFWG
ncbi:MAG: undecaprenyl-diphosphatase [Legionellales bacterium]|nr:MAG: undecaprenyl-diphosphatase [Legionellales bacterium]